MDVQQFIQADTASRRGLTQTLGLMANPLKGALGDALQTVMCGTGHNLRLILAVLRLCCAQWAMNVITPVALAIRLWGAQQPANVEKRNWIRAQGRAQTVMMTAAIMRICDAVVGERARFRGPDCLRDDCQKPARADAGVVRLAATRAAARGQQDQSTMPEGAPVR